MHTLVACIGNIFLGDDGFGCEVANALMAERLPEGVRVIDYGIRGIDLAYALVEPYQQVIIVDAISRGGAPGTIYLLEPSEHTSSTQSNPDPHSMDPAHLFSMARSVGEISAKVYIVGCEVADFCGELEGRMGLSDPVAAAVPHGVATVMDLICATLPHEQTAFCETK